MAGSLIVPGIAGADEALDTKSVTAEGQFTLTATDNGDCNATFTLDDQREPLAANWLADFRIDGEDRYMSGGLREVFRPVLTNNQRTIDAILKRPNSYNMDLGTVTVDLTKDRTVPVNNDDVARVSGVVPNETGTHTVNLGMYQGPVAAAEEDSIYDEKATITVTGCPKVAEDEEETPDAGSLNFGSLFGSLGSQEG